MKQQQQPQPQQASDSFDQYAPSHPGWDRVIAAGTDEYGPCGHCDTCGAPCDFDGCTVDRSHEIANPGIAAVAPLAVEDEPERFDEAWFGHA